jgi:hypothetical protein
VWQGIATGAASARNETLINAVDSAGAIRIGNFKLMISQGTDSWCVSHSIPFIIAPCTQIVTVRLFVSRTSLSPTCGCCILFHSLSRLDCAL